MSKATDEAETKTGELLIFDPKNLAVFNEFESQLDDLEVKNNQAVFDYADEQGNKEARSHVHSLRKSKAAIEELRKSAKKQSLEYGRALDAKGTELKSRLETMIDVHYGPILEIEEKEAARVEDIQRRLQIIREDATIHADKSSAEIGSAIKEAEEQLVTEKLFSEFFEEAKMVKAYALSELDTQFKAQKQKEDEAAELERLRKEDEERKQRENEERIRKEAQEKAEREAEEKAEVERQREQRENEARELAQKERDEKAAKELQEANERTEKAAQEERDRIAQEQADAEEAQKKRTENTRIRNTAINRAVASFVSCGLSEKSAKAAVRAIEEHRIPAIEITF